jgi:tetratricopeptide (TPR) repeat protein
VLTEAGQCNEAAKVLSADVERYGVGAYDKYYDFCVLTGRGDLAAARRMFGEFAKAYDQSTDSAVFSEIGNYDLLQGNLDDAIARFNKAEQLEDNAGYVAMTAIIRLQQKKPDEAMKILNQLAALKPDTPRTKSYAAFAVEMKRLLADPNAKPARDGDIGALLDDKDRVLQRGNIAYLFGNFCEQRGQKDEAIWWYRTSMQTKFLDFASRPLAAAALRRLGEEFFK